MKTVKAKIGSLVKIFRQAFSNWADREPFNNSVIIAYYTIFSLPGLLVIVINLATVLFEADAVTHKISGQIGGLVGRDTAKDIEAMINQTDSQNGTTLSTILSIATLLFGATGVFYQMQQVLNKMWDVKPKPKGKILKLIKDRVFSFGLVLVVGFLLLVSLVISAALSSVSDWLGARFSDTFAVVFHILDVVISVGMITLLFASIFKFLPDARIRWRDVWTGALLTSILFVVAKFALGLYFGNTNPESAYGAAGTIILIMLWVSYAGLIVLFGAEFTQVYANAHGRQVQPDDDAVSTAKTPANPKSQTAR